MHLTPPPDAGNDAPLLRAAEAAFSPDAPRQIGVALSGGGDSVALLHLMVRVARSRGGEVRAVTVDHGLRPEAADEAAFAASLCRRLGASHDILRWTREGRSGNLQDQARRARYGLIAGWAARHGIGHVAVGHTADDQAETLLMRLAREAGVDGLAGMRADWRAEGLVWSRPLLGQTRAALRAYLARQGERWIDDPSNDDPTYDRVKARRALAALTPLGITARTLAASARHLTDARQALDGLTAEVARAHVRCDAGDVIMDRAAFLAQGAEVRRRLLSGALRWIGGGTYAPRASALAGLETAVAEGRDATLAGCHLTTATGDVRITREAAALRGRMAPTDALWDGRWRFDGPHAPDLRISALMAAGLAQCRAWRATGRPRTTLAASPAIWRDETLVSAPLAGLSAGWSAHLSPTAGDFYSFLLSH